jgi:hypothetical protein
MTMRDASMRAESAVMTPETVGLLRADILGSAETMVREIQKRIPEYAPEGADRQLRAGVEFALHRYLQLLDRHVDPAPERDTDWRDLYRSVGANEMRAGRSLDALHAAIRLSARLANRRLRAFAERHALAPHAVAWLSEAIFDNTDEIAEASADGYAQARQAEAGERDRRRRHLLGLLVGDPAPSEQALTAAAAAADWRLPRRLAVVVAAPGPPAPPPILPPEILGGFDHEPPCLIVPDPESGAEIRTLVNGLAHRHVAVGLPVAPTDAGRSLRWARLALDLAAKGRIPRRHVVWCGEHLATLTVFQDEALVDALAERSLAPLAPLRADKRRLLAETLLAWLTFNRNAIEVAAHLHVHPQTVRHRLRQLTDLFGSQIRDPRRGFELEIALRARL